MKDLNKILRIILYLVILALFFEAGIFTFTVSGVRIKAVQLLGLMGACVLLYGVLTKKHSLRRTPLDIPLAGYLAVNFIAILNSANKPRSLKIACLLLVMAVLYDFTINVLSLRIHFEKAFSLFLAVGMVEISYGLYQVAAGMLNTSLKLRLPIGHLGMVHSSYIGSSWGRPYGTLVEPDWYGAVCAFFALLFLTLAVSRPKRKHLVFAGLVLSCLGLFFSFVRAAWFGFVVALIFLFIFRSRANLTALSPKKVLRVTGALLLCSVLLLAVFPSVRSILKQRFFPTDAIAPFSSRDARMVGMKDSFQSFLRSPLIGHGPGTEGRLWQFNPSLIFTVLEDTGILGMVFFAFLTWRLFAVPLRKLPFLPERDRAPCIGLLAGCSALWVSYIFTSGFWFAFTWVPVAMAIASSQLRESQEIEKMRPGGQSSQ